MFGGCAVSVTIASGQKQSPAAPFSETLSFLKKNLKIYKRFLKTISEST
jgi:hypothetical protein